jgi:Pilus assembly protein, PilO
MNRLAKSSHGFELLQPPDAWSGYRIAFTSVAVAALVFAAGVSLWRSSDPGGTEASRSALHDAQQRLDRARAMTAQLPVMRARSGEGAPLIRWTVADALHAMTALAAQSGLRIGMIEPSGQKGDGLEIERPLKFRAEGSFGEIRRFLDALEGLPRLVIPEAVQMKRAPNALALEATLRVFEDLPAITRPEPSLRDAFVIDPFGVKNGMGVGDGGAILLVGTLRAWRRGMALVETAAGVEGFLPGQMIGDERLGNVRSRSIELSRNGVARTIGFADERP